MTCPAKTVQKVMVKDEDIGFVVSIGEMTIGYLGRDPDDYPDEKCTEVIFIFDKDVKDWQTKKRENKSKAIRAVIDAYKEVG